MGFQLILKIGSSSKILPEASGQTWVPVLSTPRPPPPRAGHGSPLGPPHSWHQPSPGTMGLRVLSLCFVLSCPCPAPPVPHLLWGRAGALGEVFVRFAPARGAAFLYTPRKINKWVVSAGSIVSCFPLCRLKRTHQSLIVVSVLLYNLNMGGGPIL